MGIVESVKIKKNKVIHFIPIIYSPLLKKVIAQQVFREILRQSQGRYKSLIMNNKVQPV